MSVRRQRYFTTYVRVQKWKALQVEVHPMSSENTDLSWHFEDRHFQEILQLLRGPIFERVKLKKHEIKKDMVKSNIMTGPTVRLGYDFRAKPEYETCLLPISQPLYTSDSEEEQQAWTSGYRSLSLHHEKLVVYSCLLKEKSSHSSMAQILSAMSTECSSSSQQPQKVSISSYFHRVVPPGGTPAKSSQSSAPTPGGARSPPACTTGQADVATALPSDTRKRKLKSIIKRSGPKLSKKAKKMKTLKDILKPGIPLACARGSLEDSVTSDSEFSRMSFFGDLPEADCPTVDDNNTQPDPRREIVDKIKENATEPKDCSEIEMCTRSESYKNLDLFSEDSHKKCKVTSVCGDNDNIQINSGNHGNRSYGSEDMFMEHCDEETEDEVNITELKKAESEYHTAKEKMDSAICKPVCSPTRLQYDVTYDSEGSDCCMMPEISLQSEQVQVSVTDHIPHSRSEPIFKGSGFKHLRMDFIQRRLTVGSNETLPSASFIHEFDPDTPDVKSGRVVAEGNGDEGCTKRNRNVETEGSVSDKIDYEDLPQITLKKRDRSWRKSLALLMKEKDSPQEVEKEVIDCDTIDCDLIEVLEELPRHPMILTEDLRQELSRVRTESELRESHIQMMVLASEGYLRSIFTGQIQCRRHEDYKRGGIARLNLNYQVNLGMFSEPQQDAVMETLMAIFCKRHHKYMDYLLKVLLPEMMIRILMEVKHTTYDDTEALMSGAIQ